MPTHLRSLKPFYCPLLMEHQVRGPRRGHMHGHNVGSVDRSSGGPAGNGGEVYQLLHEHPLQGGKVPPSLQRWAQKLCKAVLQHYGQRHMVVRLSFDIEAALDTSYCVQGRPAPKDIPPPHVVPGIDISPHTTYHYR